MYSPVATLVKLSGEPAVIETPFIGDSRDYVPSDTSDFAPAQPQKATVKGIWSDQWADGFADGEIATFLIKAESLPTDAKPMMSKLTRLDTVYNITRIRQRVYLGKIDGYNLILGR